MSNSKIKVIFITGERNVIYRYNDKDPNHMFISFLRTFLNIFQASFPVKYKSTEEENDWVSQGR
jgi:hypothetical protein